MSELAIETSGVASGPLDFSTVYQGWFRPVECWLRSLGVPESEREDLAQEVFLVVRRKLGGFDGRNLASWLYRIAQRTASDHRRRAWYRRLFLGRRDIDLAAIEERGANPAELLEQKQKRAQLHRLLDKMSEKRRVAFVLFEVEGMSGEEIAAAMDVPVATIWTRLHHARKDFLALCTELRAEERA